jgi:hypothetical protein
MPRHSRYQRPTPFLVSKPTILIVSEGKETEPRYFEELKTRNREVVTVIISKGRDGQTNPKRVLKRLKQEVRNRASWDSRDQAWLVVDTDQWTEAERQEIELAVSKDSQIHLAASNPCFELWLLLHFRDGWDAITASDLDRLLGSPDCLTNYHKKNYNVSILMKKINDAIHRAKTSDSTTTDKWGKWPLPGKTHVYKVVENIIRNH